MNRKRSSTPAGRRHRGGAVRALAAVLHVVLGLGRRVFQPSPHLYLASPALHSLFTYSAPTQNSDGGDGGRQSSHASPALHSLSLCFALPISSEIISFCCPAPPRVSAHPARSPHSPRPPVPFTCPACATVSPFRHRPPSSLSTTYFSTIRLYVSLLSSQRTTTMYSLSRPTRGHQPVLPTPLVCRYNISVAGSTAIT